MPIFHGTITSNNSITADNFIYYTPQKQLQSVQSFAFTQITLFNYFENITNDYNTFQYVHSNNIQTIVLPNDFYTLDALYAEIIKQFSLAGISITINTLPNNLIQIDSTDPLLFIRSQVDYQNQIYRYLGFSKTNNIFTTSNIVFNADEYPFAQVTSSINIHVPGFTAYSLDFDGFYLGIPLSQSFTEVIDWQNKQLSANNIIFSNISVPSISIRLLDDNNRPMNLGKQEFNTIPFSFQFIMEGF